MRGAREQAETRVLGQRLPLASQGFEGQRDSNSRPLCGEAAFLGAALKASSLSLSEDVSFSVPGGSS